MCPIIITTLCIYYYRFVLIRASENTTSEEFVKMAAVLEDALNMKPVRILLKQHRRDPTQIAVECVPSSKYVQYYYCFL